MGLINNDTFTASNGVQKAGTYISFNNETIYLRKQSQYSPLYPANTAIPTDSSKIYMVNANYRVFWDKAAKDDGKSFIELRNVATFVSESELNGNLYAVLYEELKKQYPNSEDELTTQVGTSSDSSSTTSSSSSDSTSTPANTIVTPST